MTIRGGDHPKQAMVLTPVSRLGPPPRSFAADAHDCIMVRSLWTYRIQGCGAILRARWQAPLGPLCCPTKKITGARSKSALTENAPYKACSAFTRVAACTLALPPIRDTLSEGFSYFVTSIAAPVASGWSVRRVGLAPTGKRRLVTAHTHSGRSRDVISPAILQLSGARKVFPPEFASFAFGPSSLSFQLCSCSARSFFSARRC